ncbi:transcriptional regulator, ArsR family [Streptomyces sp. 1222.5]|uniref:ArsR/SmtB family transcription factor n=1 Tax=unclassified Streptomyces TaxID=2593676 RepID=UPI00089B4120|nr:MULTISPECIES: metalloregulator ArsR/SmtB family transcription factor [unclassified Streptomyces]PKW05226.1 ArsR family transcriptional regulator [Streptomyces sp. 5112.2]SED46609.1 transcriptional regulator, ArsR family [Streptomyces sp. 1222.5]
MEDAWGDPARKAALFDSLATAGKALANGKRLELLDLLAQGERNVDALAKAAGLGLTTASAHLQTLRRAGLVTTRRDGVRIHYRLAGDDVAALYVLLQQVARAHLAQAEHARAAYLGPRGTEHLTREELLERVKTGTATVIDVRPAEEYAAGHIPGALSVPLDQLDARLAELPADIEIVAYCRGANSVLAHDAVRRLAERGRRAKRLADGMLEWRLAALPVETAAA